MVLGRGTLKHIENMRIRDYYWIGIVTLNNKIPKKYKYWIEILDSTQMHFDLFVLMDFIYNCVQINNRQTKSQFDKMQVNI